MCLKDKNYNLHFEYFFKKNKNSIILYILFLLFLVLQIIPLPLNLLKIFAVEKFQYINLLRTDIKFSSIRRKSPFNFSFVSTCKFKRSLCL